jgi:hypothetical protein
MYVIREDGMYCGDIPTFFFFFLFMKGIFSPWTASLIAYVLDLCNHNTSALASRKNIKSTDV